jgi:adenosine/AMP kinase
MYHDEEKQIDHTDVMVDLWKTKQEFNNKTDEDLVRALGNFSPSVKFTVSLNSVVARFLKSGKLTNEDRKLVIGCFLIRYTKYMLEE